jgi:hypothetical protein
MIYIVHSKLSSEKKLRLAKWVHHLSISIDISSNLGEVGHMTDGLTEMVQYGERKHLERKHLERYTTTVNVDNSSF